MGVLERPLGGLAGPLGRLMGAVGVPPLVSAANDTTVRTDLALDVLLVQMSMCDALAKVARREVLVTGCIVWN
jgi:hypothetical protein